MQSATERQMTDEAFGTSDYQPEFNTGVLPSQGIRAAIERGEIMAQTPITEAQVQPASLDLRLGARAYRLRASFLPGRQATVAERIAEHAMYDFGLEDGGVLEKGCVYIVELEECLDLRAGRSGLANPKSSTGRLDIFARLITDHGVEFDRVRERYSGPLYAEISPRSFSVKVQRGTRLVQLRLKDGSPPPRDAEIRRLHAEVPLVDTAGVEADIKAGKIAFTVDLVGDGPGSIIGYKARNDAGLIDVEKPDFYDPADFWLPVHAREGRGIVLYPDDFYILASKEAVTVPRNYAAEMLAYSTEVGEFRVHYAGFFDPGFGDPDLGAGGTRGVLEVRSHEVPFLIDDGQIVGRLMYERLTCEPDKLYGSGIGSSYQRQKLALSKQFKPWD